MKKSLSWHRLIEKWLHLFFKRLGLMLSADSCPWLMWLDFTKWHIDLAQNNLDFDYTHSLWRQEQKIWGMFSPSLFNKAGDFLFYFFFTFLLFFFYLFIQLVAVYYLHFALFFFPCCPQAIRTDPQPAIVNLCVSLREMTRAVVWWFKCLSAI